MAKFEVDIGNATYEVDAPDEQTAWNWANITHAKESKPKPETTIGGNLKEAVKGVVPGAIGLLETAGAGASALLPEEYELPTRQFIKEAAATGRKPFEAAPGYEESVGRKLGEGIGSTVPFFALGPMGGIGRAAAGALGVSAGAGEARMAAEQKGATPEEIRKATQLGAPVGLLDMIAPEIGPLKHVITTALARGGIEGATEAAQKVAQNMIAKGIYDPSQDVLAGSGEEGAYGAGVGALASLLVDLTLGRKAHGVSSKAVPLKTPAQAPEESPLLALPPPEAPAGEPEQPLLPGPPDQLRIGMNPRQIELDQQSLANQRAEEFGKALEEMGPAGATDVTQMPGMTGAPNANMSMMEQARAAREAKAKAEEKQRKIEIKKIQSTTFHADPIQNQKIKDQMLADLGVTVPEAKAVAAEPVVKEELTPEEQAMIETRGPTTDEIVSPNAGLEAKDIRKEQKQLEQANLKGTPAPASQEIVDEIKGLREIRANKQKELDEASAVKGNLFNELRGKIKVQPGAFGLKDLNIDEKQANQLVNKEGGGRLLEDMVADGSLDDYLSTPHDSEDFDAQEAVQEIADKLAKKDYRAHIVSSKIDTLKNEKDEINKRIEELQGIPEANLNLGQAAEEQADIEGLSTDDLLARAQELGIDTGAIAEDVARQTEHMTAEQYHGEARKALISAINTQTGGTETLAQANKGQKGFTATKEDLKTQAELKGKTMIGVAEWAIKNAPNKFSKFVAEKVLARLKALEKQGVTLGFNIEDGNRRSNKLYSAQGVTDFIWGIDGNHTVINISLNGAPVMENQLGYPSGLGYDTVMHELLHAATRGQMRFLASTDPLVKELRSLYNTVVDHFNAEVRAGRITPFMERIYKRNNNALLNPDELISWGLTDKEMQAFLNEIKVGEKTVMDKIVQLVRELLGIPKSFETALDRLVRTTDKLLEADVKVLANGMVQEGYTLGRKPGQQSLFSKRAQELFGKESFSKQSGKAQQPTSSGQESLNDLAKMGRVVDEEEGSAALKKARETWDNVRDNPKATAEAAQQSFSRFMDRVQTWAFSSDAGLQNNIRKAIMDSSVAMKDKIGLLLNASLSQTVHSDAVANLFLRKGKIRYDKDLYKWVGEDSDANFVTLSKQLDAIAQKENLTKQEIELIAHTAFEAKRTKSLVKFNQELEAKIAALRAEAASKRASSPVAASALSKEAANLQNDFKYIHLKPEEIEIGMKLFKRHPELNEVVKTWNEIRDNAAAVMKESGLWSEADADFLLSNADYVPLYREDQLENNKGPKEFIRGLKVQAKERKLKGSDKPVNDIFDNQMRWVQYSINRAVRNRSAVALAETAADAGLADRIDDLNELAGVSGKGNPPNPVSVWVDGKEVRYNMHDPMFMEAFTGLEAIVIPSWKWAADMANVLRQSVVMYPLFSVAQVPQDSFAAIFSSGLKPQHALRIPVLAVKEFVQTLRGKSKYHEELKNYGAVGVRDFTSAMVRLDAEVYAGFKAPAGVMGKVKHSLNHIAMAADNAVRQAVYEASMDQGLSQAEALEKAFDVFNVRRKGSSKSLALAGQLIPFFSAYLAAQDVAYKTITGKGISPTERQDAFKTLAATTASVMTLSLLYAMMNGDDEDYLNKPATVRDRLLMVPGTGGFSLPLRADLFTMPKIITEHTYLMMTDKGYEDGRKFRDSMAAALGSAILSPTAVPQAIKPLVEVGINYDFFQGRPLVGTYQQKLDTERQFTDSTSELGKILGQTGLVSPIAADHLLRGMFGSAGGLIIYMTNPMLHSDPNTPRPSLSERDAIASLPGMSGFMSKQYETALKKDFYTLKEEVDKAANTMNDLKTRSPHEIEGFLGKEENLARVGLQKSVNKIGGDLSKIRKAITQITNSDMPSDQKQEQLQMLREAENAMLKNVDVKMLRELGKI